MKNIHVAGRIILVLLLVFTAAAGLSAQEKPMITVLPFSSIEVPAYVSQVISQLFETHLVNTQAYDVLSQNERDQILAAQAESLEGCTDESCAIEIGRMLAAEQVILGTVATLGTKYIINAKIIDVTTSKTLGADMISATSVEDLDNACRTLTYSLVEKALPEEALVEAEPEPEPEPAPAPAPEPEPEPEAAPAPAPEPEPAPAPAPEPEVAEEPAPPAPKPKPVRPAGGGINKVLTAGGVVLQTAGNFTNAVAYPVLVESERVYRQYLAMETNPGELFESDSSSGTYYDYYDGYTAFTYGSLGLSGAGGTVLSAQAFIGRGSSFSTLGKIVYSAGISAMAAGNIFGQMAVAGYTLADGYYDEYLEATEGTDILWNRYENTYSEQYTIPRYTSFGLWGTGMAMMASAALLPGNGTAANGFLNKILYAAGSLMLSGGNVTAMMAQNTLVESRRAYNEYEAASANLDTLYQSYEDLYGAYGTLTYASYGLWIGGAVLAAASLFIPGGSGADVAELPFGLEIIPAPVGYGAEIHIQTR